MRTQKVLESRNELKSSAVMQNEVDVLLSRSQEQIKQQIMQICQSLEQQNGPSNEEFRDQISFLESQKSLIEQTLQINLKSHFKNQTNLEQL